MRGFSALASIEVPTTRTLRFMLVTDIASATGKISARSEFAAA